MWVRPLCNSKLVRACVKKHRLMYPRRIWIGDPMIVWSREVSTLKSVTTSFAQHEIYRAISWVARRIPQILNILYINSATAVNLMTAVDKSVDPTNREVCGVNLRPLACWDFRFQSLHWHGFFFFGCEFRMLIDRCPCDELITCPEKSYRLWRAVVCDLETSTLNRSWLAMEIDKWLCKIYNNLQHEVFIYF
jgi:hypothetical protein